MPAIVAPRVETFGCKVKGKDQLYYDRYAFAQRMTIDEGAPPRLELFKRIEDKVLPKHFEWNEWTTKLIEPALEGTWCCYSGCSNSSKTYNTMGFATLWWLAAPAISSVTLVSTSIKSLRRRGWAEVQKNHTSIPGNRLGHFIDSRMMWQWNKGDDKHAMIGKAVEEGPVHKVADDIKGVHTQRQMVIIDEATAVPEAIFDACFNLYSYPDEFILIVIGNPRSKLDQMGRFMEPKNGWVNVSVDTDEWETKPQINGKPALVVRFDAEKSPNIKEGKIVSRHLPTKEKVATAKANGETPLYYSNFRGFPPPDGLTKTVFTESAFMVNDGFGKHLFTGNNFRIIGAFDASRGGDRPVLRFAKMGEIAEGKMGIELFPPIVIPVDAKSKNPISYQLTEQVRKQCESFTVGQYKYTCSPDNLAVDASGDGAGLCDIMNRTWSFGIVRILFGGKASEDATSLEDSRPACEVYRNKRAEMYYRASDALNHGQLKGFDADTAKELCDIQFDDSKPLLVLEDKDTYKERHNGQSPDLSDATVMVLEVARRKGFKLSAQQETATRTVNWSETVQKTRAVYEDSNCYQSEEME